MDWIVIVDDDDENLIRTADILKQEKMRVTKLSSGQGLLDYVEGMSPLPDLILLDIIMPEMNGIDAFKALRARGGGSTKIPVIFITGNEDLAFEKEGLALGAEDYIRKPYYPEILKLRVKRALERARLRNNLQKEVEEKTKEINRFSLHLVQTLAEAIDAKDTYTNGHSGRVATYSKELAKKLGYDEQGQDEVYIMGLLHDVGKIGVPDWIINKPERLTDEEYAEIKKHPDVGNRILKKVQEIPKLALGARWHHERIDGRGYPDGLRGNMIPEEARIIAVADAYDAMTSNRSYRKALPQEVVKAELEKGKGSQFDEKIVDIMIRMIDEDKDYVMREGEAEHSGLRDRSAEETVIHMDAQPILPLMLTELGQLDTELGLFLCGDVEDYLHALSVFAGSISVKSAKLEDAFVKKDISAYTTLVHSLKSASRTVGATEISDLARQLETAGKSGDLETIQKDTPRLLSLYRDLEAPLRDILSLA